MRCGAVAALYGTRRASSPSDSPTIPPPFFHHASNILPLLPSVLQWKEAVANGTVNQAAATPSYNSSDAAPEGKALSLGQLMAFSGPAPELINGRLAM